MMAVSLLCVLEWLIPVVFSVDRLKQIDIEFMKQLHEKVFLQKVNVLLVALIYDDAALIGLG